VLKEADVDEEHIEVLKSDLSLSEMETYFVDLLAKSNSNAQAAIEKVKQKYGI
jgi:hypothetical protein